MPRPEITGASDRRLNITAVGDMMFDTRLQLPRIFFQHPAVASCIQGMSFPGVPYINDPEARRRIKADALVVDGIEMTTHATDAVPLNLPAGAERDPHYPFLGVIEELRRSQIVFGNLESPLSTRGRRLRNDVCYSARPDFSAALADVPFHVVSFANNHCMDFGELAFADTLQVLEDRGIAVIGAGRNLEDARRAAIFDVSGVRIAFLGYTMIGPDSIFACDGECGAAPLNPLMLEQDLERVRPNADLVVVSAHWGGELIAKPWPWLVGFAHRMVDCGVDVVLGHHAHIPGAIEIYRNRPIFYSLGNFSFGHSHSSWDNNMIVRLSVEKRAEQCRNYANHRAVSALACGRHCCGCLPSAPYRAQRGIWNRDRLSRRQESHCTLATGATACIGRTSMNVGLTLGCWWLRLDRASDGSQGQRSTCRRIER